MATKPKKLNWRKCKVCAEDFATRGKELCCSATCRGKARTAGERKANCEFCRRPFTCPSHGRPQKFCSPACQVKHARRERNTRVFAATYDARVLVRPNMKMLADDIAQAKALAALEGLPFDHKSFMRQHSPWQERYELSEQP